MRSHRHVLRQIAQQNLDPKIPYVNGENGTLVPKSLEENSKETQEEQTNPSTEEAKDEKTSSLSEEKPKKKFPPPRKKKTEPASG